MGDDIGRSVRARAPYQAIVDRPKLKLPGGARVAVYTIVNVENWRPELPMPRTILPAADGAAAASRRAELGRGTNTGCASVSGASSDVLSTRGAARHLRRQWLCLRTLFPRVPCRARGRLGVHGPRFRAGADAQAGRPAPGDRRHDRGASAPSQAGPRAAGKALASPKPTRRSTCSPRPASNMSRIGCSTTCRRGSRRARPIHAVPYPVEINDVVISAVQLQPSDALFNRGRDTFDRLYAEGADIPRIMPISIHPYLTGVPHRIKYLEQLYDYIKGHEGVAWMTGEEILDWYVGATELSVVAARLGAPHGFRSDRRAARRHHKASGPPARRRRRSGMTTLSP